MSRKKNLPEIIKANPGCVAIIDNDCWYLYKNDPETAPEDAGDEYDKWMRVNLLASDGDEFDPRLGDGGYGSGNCYGGDVLQACAIIAGVKIKSV